MANINTTQSRKFNNGGTLTISIGGTDYVVLRLHSGGIVQRMGVREKIPIFDRGEWLETIEGQMGVSVFEFDFMYTRVGGTELPTIMRGSPSPVTGLPKLFSIEVKTPKARGLSGAGNEDTVDYVNAWVTEWEITEGGPGEMDHVKFTLNSPDEPAFASA